MSSTWADQPWALIPTPKTTEESPHAAVVLAQEMCQAHNAFIRGLNSIYLQCHLIKEKQDIEDFLYFAATWAHIIDEHHNIEETIMFPSYEILAKKPGLLSHAADQHHAFRQGLLDVQDYCKQTKAEDYDSQKLKGIIDSFADQLYEHLHEELDMLPSLAEYTDSLELARVTDEVTQQAMKKAKVNALPILLGLCDRTYEGGTHVWPKNLPKFLPYLAYYWFGWTQPGSLRFCPSDTWMNPRPLLFLPRVQTET